MAFRREAAEAEAARVAAEEAEQSEAQARQANVDAHGKFLAEREAGVKAIGVALQALAAAVSTTMQINRELWAAATEVGERDSQADIAATSCLIACNLSRLPRVLTDRGGVTNAQTAMSSVSH